MKSAKAADSGYGDGLITERQSAILEILIENPGTSVIELSRMLEVTDATIRNDLNHLSSRGLIVRSHGKATPSLHPMMIRRQRSSYKEKMRIAKKAAEMIGNGDTVMIDSGTTTAIIPRYLIGKRDIHVITNSILQIAYFRLNPSITFEMVGGEYRFLDECFVGPLALDALSRFNARYAFIGTIGFTAEHGLTTYSLEIADIIIQMVRRADKVVLCADSSKWGKTGNVNTIPLSEVDYLVTDDEATDDLKRQMSEQGVQVVIV
jgi:DeoR family transcriptional regulator, galactitol utilization operon repressor